MRLKHLSARATPRGDDGDDVRALNRAAFIRDERWPVLEAVRQLGLSDAEIERILLDNNTSTIHRGTVERSDFSDSWTVQRLGFACIAQGWSIVPQIRFGETRKPAPSPYFVRNAQTGALKELTEPFLPTRWRTRRHTLREFLNFENLRDVNLALQCCAASGHIRVLDVDCRDPEIAARVKAIAFETLGETGFVRYGARPKLQLLYRVEGEDISIGRWSIDLKAADGKDDLDADGHPINAVEFLAEGGIFTAYGLHHKTRQNFDWSEGSMHPAIAGPSHAPLVTKTMLREFTNRLAELRPISGGQSTSNPYGAKSTVTEFNRVNGRIWTPRRAEGDWTIDADGRVTNGADSWLTAQAWALCAANARDLHSVYPLLQEWLELEAVRRLGRSHRDNIGYSSEDRIIRNADEKLRTAAAKWRVSIDHFVRTGRYDDKAVPWQILDDGRRPTAQRITPSPRPADGSLDWIPDDACAVPALAASKPKAKTAYVTKSAEQLDADRQARALIEDPNERKRVTDAVSVGVRAAVNEFLGTIGWDPVLMVLKAPTGAGKTVGVLGEMAPWLKANPRKQHEGPVLLVVPTHANADEAIAVAERQGMYTGGILSLREVDETAESLRGLGVKVATFRGRAAAGCKKKEAMALLTGAGIRGSDLCKKTVVVDDEITAKLKRKNKERPETDTIMCEFLADGSCGYWRQFDELRTADLVIVAHAYLTQHALPKELGNPRAVIIDESIVYQLLDQYRFPASTLNLPRPEPWVTEAEKKANPGVKANEISRRIYGNREHACGTALKAIADGRPIAETFYALPDGPAMVRDAIIVCKRAHDADREVRPDLTDAEIAALAKKEAATDLGLEERFWRIVSERMDMLADGSAKGPRDMRLQIVEHTNFRTGKVEPHIRVSRRKTPNWAGAPTLLLDASTSPKIVSKLFGRPATVREIEAPLHVRTVAMIERTWSNSSFIPPADATDDEIAAVAKTIEEARALITTQAVIYGYGRVLVGTTITVREVLTQGGWLPPPNVDFCHFGALRGLDFAKNHVCAISIGRSEQPIGIVDGYAAALTYDDDEPEEPHDKLGTGLGTDGKPLFRVATERTIMMRTGQDVSHFVPEMPGVKMVDKHKFETVRRSWGQALEEQWREEELRQFLGRLRPVYRGIGAGADAEPPVWISVGKIQPAGIIIDEIVEMGQIIKPSPFMELVRLGGGIVSENVTPHLPAARELMAGRTLDQMRVEYLPKGDGYVKRLVDGMAQIVYRLPGDAPGKKRRALVASAWFDGDFEAEWESLSEKYGHLPSEIVDVRPSKRQAAAPAGRKKPDRIDAVALPLGYRLDDETDLRAVRAAMPASSRLSLTEIEVLMLRGVSYQELTIDLSKLDPIE